MGNTHQSRMPEALSDVDPSLAAAEVIGVFQGSDWFVF